MCDVMSRVRTNEALPQSDMYTVQQHEFTMQANGASISGNMRAVRWDTSCGAPAEAHLREDGSSARSFTARVQLNYACLQRDLARLQTDPAHVQRDLSHVPAAP